MDQHWIIVYLLVVCAHLSHQRSTPDAKTYIAAVVEYPPKYLGNSNETLNQNSKAYIGFISIAASVHKADIIVFPEDGLTSVALPEREKMGDWTTIIPSASDNYIPCNQNTIGVSETLKKISCAALDYEIYVIINIAEKAACTAEPCPKDKVFYYNSNVVFDRTGKIIARYRKTHLYEEYQFNVTAVPEVVIFDTDFGVKFGTFTCFDILFREPATTLTRVHKITDIVFPTAWFSEMPFLTAAQVQAGWSYAEDVNFLASGYNRPSFGNAGSGIYLGRKGVGKAIMPTTMYEELVIFEVPKIKQRTSHNRNDHSENQEQKAEPHYHEEDTYDERKNGITLNDKIFLSHNNIHTFETFSLEGNATETICQNNFCCEFKVEIAKIDPSTKYRLVTFNGIRLYSVVKAAVRVCGIIQCSNDSISSCGSVQKSETTFSNIEITTTFHNYKNSLIMPSTLNPGLLPLKNWAFNDHVHNDHVHVNMFLNNNTNDLVTFGIYARNFNSANKTSFYIINYIIVLLVILLLSKL